jgi:hypothetical protein
MDLAVILPLGILLALQGLLSLALLAPRGLSKRAAALLALTRKQPAQSVVFTIAAAVFAMTLSSTIQLSANSASFEKTFGDSRCVCSGVGRVGRPAAAAVLPPPPPPPLPLCSCVFTPPLARLHNTTQRNATQLKAHTPQPWTTTTNNNTNKSMLALTIDELRALLALALGAANLLLLFVNRALAAEQQAADKAALNLAVLQKQVCFCVVCFCVVCCMRALLCVVPLHTLTQQKPQQT